MVNKRDLNYSQNLKLHPKLKMFSNGDEKVNRVRSELSSCLVIDKKSKLNNPLVRTQSSQPFNIKEYKKGAHQPLDRGNIKKVTGVPKVNVFIHLSPNHNPKKKLPGETARNGNLVTCTATFSEIEQITREDGVVHVEPGQPMHLDNPIITNSFAEAPRSRVIDSLELSNDAQLALRNSGKVLIGIIDVGGFDFAHPDFLDARGNTRFISIWDQGAISGTRPNPYTYGNLISQEQMNSAIDTGKQINVPPHSIEPQTQRSIGSHATHVTGIAGGNSGVCPDSEIVGVLVSLSDEDSDRRRSFYDSTRIVHAVDHLLKIGEERGLPISINISLGTNGHAHDGTAPVCRWIDSELTKNGRSICVASGNSGQEKPVSDGGIGFVMGRIHSSGKIPSQGLTKEIEWEIVGNNIADLSENELEIWYNPQDRLSVRIKPPGMPWIEKIHVGEYIENRMLRDKCFISVYNEIYNHANGKNLIGIYLSPFLNDNNPDGIIGITSGKWIVQLHGEEIRDGSFHAWIERDDPRRLGPMGNRVAWNFPSYFTESSNVDNTSVSSLACGHNVVGVANLDKASNKINISSSQGPTADGRFKPDVSAPGTNITAAKGFAGNSDLWTSKTGTSMASPYACGIIALMLKVENKLTASQILGILKRTSNPLPGQTYEWHNDTGFGAINASRCIEEAKVMNIRTDRT